jgi:tripartite-type tricarboxylate transporter receptor subunit TctC
VNQFRVTRRESLLAALAGAATFASGLPASAAETWPTKPIKLEVGFTAGGAVDNVARQIGLALGGRLGQSFVIENRAGATGTLAADYVAKSAPDGYTIGIVGGSHNINKYLFKNLGWDPEKSFEPIVYSHVVPLVFAINPQIPAKTLPEFVAWMKAHPDQAKVATSGRGSAQEMAAEMFRMAAGTDMLLVPYKGSSAAHPDLLGGRTALFIDTISAILPQVKGGNVRAVAVSTLKRTPALPDVPTADEQGLKGYDANTNGGFLAPAGTPKAIVAKLNAEINAALKLPDVRTKLEAAGVEIQGGSPQDYAALIKADLVKWGKVVKQAGIEPE